MVILFIAALMAASFSPSIAADSKGSFDDNFSIMWSEDHFKTSEDGQIWYLNLDNDTGNHKAPNHDSHTCISPQIIISCEFL